MEETKISLVLNRDLQFSESFRIGTEILGPLLSLLLGPLLPLTLDLRLADFRTRFLDVHVKILQLQLQEILLVLLV
jgi:hypothetical protein